MIRLNNNAAIPGAPLTAANAVARCSPWWSLMMPGITITSSAAPAPENAVPSSVTGHDGPRQNSVTPITIEPTERTSARRRPR